MTTETTSIWERERLIREARQSLPTLPFWAFQPEEDTPGLYLQCETIEQRVRIMRALGAPEELCK